MYQVQHLTSSRWEPSDGERLQKQILEACRAHHDDGRALLFAFILFSSDDAHIAKMLRDDDYWNSLNLRAGRYLTVFALTEGFSSLADPASLWNADHRSDATRAVEDMKGLFDQATLKLPCILFFQIKGRKVIDGFAVDLTSSSARSTFLELQRLFIQTAEALAELKEHNRSNRQEVFSLVKQKITSGVMKYRISLWTKRALTVVEMVNALRESMKL